MSDVRDLMQIAPVIPVLVIDSVDQAEPLARALVAGGLRVLEVTLRTPVALEALTAMTRVEGAVVGVGTALDAGDLERAHAAGATFAVTPGLTTALSHAARDIGVPLLPGVATASEIIHARDLGHNELKFFPAEQAGGVAMLKAFGGPFGQTVFCPTGGIDAAKAGSYLALSNVLCVGGSWVAPKAMVQAGDWQGITDLAAAAVSAASRA